MNYIDRKGFMYGGADDYGYGVDAGIGSNISSGPGGGDPNPGGGGNNEDIDSTYTTGKEFNVTPQRRSFFDTLGGGINTIGDIYNRFSPIQNIGRGIRGIGRGIGNLFDKFADLRGFNPDGSRRTQEEYEEARQNRINQNRIANIMGRDAPFTQMTLDNLERLGYTGPMGQDLIGTTNAIRSGSSDRFDNNFITQDIERGIVQNDPLTFREYFNENPLYRGTSTAKDLGVSVGDMTMQNPSYNFRDAMEEINLQRGITGPESTGELIANQLSFPFDTFNTGDPYKDNLYDQDGNYKPSLNNLFAKVDGPAQIQMRRLENQAGMEQFGGTPLTPGERKALEQLKQMDADQDNVYTTPVSIV
jgi:hypothetical protein